MANKQEKGQTGRAGSLSAGANPSPLSAESLPGPYRPLFNPLKPSCLPGLLLPDSPRHAHFLRPPVLATPQSLTTPLPIAAPGHTHPLSLGGSPCPGKRW